MKTSIDAWIARDESGALFISKRKPERQLDNTWDSWDMDWVALSKDAFAGIEITWGDEPRRCRISIEY